MTLRAKDLMVGDWVYNTKKEICKVCDVSYFFGESNFHLDNYSKENDGGFDLELEVFPIPLTPEILEKNGFVKGLLNVSYQYNLELSDCFIGVTLQWTPDRQVEIFCYSPITKLECTLTSRSEDHQWYLHDLQHALRLCGIDKEIEL